MKFLISLMLTTLTVIIVGLCFAVFYSEFKDDVALLSQRITAVEAADPGKNERKTLSDNLKKLERRIDPLPKMISDIDVELATKIMPKIERNRKDLDSMIEELSLYCVAAPEESAFGAKRYPANKDKYGATGFCAEIFTADDCKNDRLNEILPENEIVMLKITLQDAPTYGFRTNLERLDFKMSRNCLGEEKTCREWLFNGTLAQKDIKRLKLYAKEIEYCQRTN